LCKRESRVVVLFPHLVLRLSVRRILTGIATAYLLTLQPFAEPSYPNLVSTDREDGTAIPFSGTSSLSACPKNASCDSNLVYPIEDSAVAIERIVIIDTH
jgi:hypothetical protein